MIDDMRTTLDLDDDVLQAIKEIGSMQKKTAGHVLSELARKAYQLRLDLDRVRLLPTRPGAPIMTMADVNRLRDEM